MMIIQKRSSDFVRFFPHYGRVTMELKTIYPKKYFIKKLGFFQFMASYTRRLSRRAVTSVTDGLKNTTDVKC